MKTYILCAVWVLASAVGQVGRVDAQQPAARPPYAAGCGSLQDRLLRGRSEAERLRALREVTVCGRVGGAALAAALRDHRYVSASPDRLERYAFKATLFKDAEVFRSAMDVAADRGASHASRIRMLWVLYHQIGAMPLPYEAFASPNDTLYIPPTDAPNVVGAPLPRDAAAAVLRLALRTQGDPREASSLRIAARVAAGGAAAQLLRAGLCRREQTATQCARQVGAL